MTRTCTGASFCGWPRKALRAHWQAPSAQTSPMAGSAPGGTAKGARSGGAVEVEMVAIPPVGKGKATGGQAQGCFWRSLTDDEGQDPPPPSSACCLCGFSKRRNCGFCFLLILAVLVFVFWPRACSV